MHAAAFAGAVDGDSGSGKTSACRKVVLRAAQVTRPCTEARSRPVWIIDEAHHLRPDVLEDLR